MDSPGEKLPGLTPLGLAGGAVACLAVRPCAAQFEPIEKSSICYPLGTPAIVPELASRRFGKPL
jgi:hypothetical protein